MAAGTAAQKINKARTGIERVFMPDLYPQIPLFARQYFPDRVLNLRESGQSVNWDGIREK
jgi:hypothetical protein